MRAVGARTCAQEHGCDGHGPHRQLPGGTERGVDEAGHKGAVEPCMTGHMQGACMRLGPSPAALPAGGAAAISPSRGCCWRCRR